jgi:hypothetical protein
MKASYRSMSMLRLIIIPVFLITISTTSLFSLENNEGGSQQEEVYTFPAGGAQDLLHLKALPHHLQAENDSNKPQVSLHSQCKASDGSLITSDDPRFESCVKENTKK